MDTHSAEHNKSQFPRWEERLQTTVKADTWKGFHLMHNAFLTGVLIKEREWDVIAIASSMRMFIRLLDTPEVPLDSGLKNEKRCTSELKALSEEGFADLLKDLGYVLSKEAAEKDSWKDKLIELLENPFFIPKPDIVAQQQATIAAWNVPYKGTLHKDLWDHIMRLVNQRIDMNNENMCHVIQSSGSGKSRLVDQLGTEHLVIPICLRDEADNGFPPCDQLVSEYLAWSLSSYYKAGLNIGAFLQALFETTERRIDAILSHSLAPGSSSYGEIADSFRKLMTENQTFWKHNEYRCSFYEEVIRRAKEITSKVEAENPISKASEVAISAWTLRPEVDSACRSLDQKLLSLEGPRRREPLVIVAFDESEKLSRFSSGGVPIFDILCNRIGSLGDRSSIFALFLSTTERIPEVSSPRSANHPSSRLVLSDWVRNPSFTGCIFDAFPAKEISMEEGRMTIQEAASEWCMMHLGRPLWATRVDTSLHTAPIMSKPGAESVTRSGLRFAMTKLLRRDDFPESGSLGDISDDEVVACLCHRLPIEFQSAAALQEKFVTNHMRLCVRHDPKPETMLTISASEPVLAEAAFVVTRQGNCSPLRAMQWLLRRSAVNKGDRGELVVLLLVLLARDEVVARNNESMLQNDGYLEFYSSETQYPRHLGEPSLCDWDRVFSVPEFLRALFGELKEVQADIDSLFKNTRVHFNHFIKVYQQELLHSRYLTGLLMRGAALLCANNREPVDAVVPFLFQDVIDRRFVGHILIQMKNDSKYTHEMKPELFDSMNPAGMEVTAVAEEEDKEPLPVVRIVFALAASQASVTTRKIRIRLKDGRSCWAVDIWCAGISPNIFPSIVRSGDLETWKSVIAYSQRWNSDYMSPGERYSKECLRRMTPFSEKDRQFWQYSPGILKGRNASKSPHIIVPPRPLNPDAIHIPCNAERERDTQLGEDRIS